MTDGLEQIARELRRQLTRKKTGLLLERRLYPPSADEIEALILVALERAITQDRGGR